MPIHSLGLSLESPAVSLKGWFTVGNGLPEYVALEDEEPAGQPWQTNCFPMSAGIKLAAREPSEPELIQ